MWKQRIGIRALLLASCFLAVVSLGTGLCLAGWLGEERTSDDPSGQGLEGGRCIAADTDGNLHAVWEGGCGLCYRKYLRDVGWESVEEQVYSVGPVPAYDWCVAVDGAGNVHVIWLADVGGYEDIYYSERHALTGWDAAATLLGNPNGLEWSPSIAADSRGVVHAVWTRMRLGGPEIRYMSKDPVTGWGNGYIISAGDGVASTDPAICADSQDNLHVVWVGGNYDIYYLKYTFGVGWDASPTRLTLDGLYKDEACVVADGLGCIHVAWRHGGATYYEIDYKKYTPGSGWDSVVTAISPVDSLDSWDPSIAADQLGAVHVVWADYDSRTNWGDIFCRHFYPATGWSEPEQVTVTTTGCTYIPSMAVDPCGNGGVIYLRHEGWEVCLKRWVNDATAGSSKTIAAEGLICHAYPNPFGGSIQILYQLPEALSSGGKMRLDVLDAEGRVIRTLVEGQSAPGEHRTAWNGSNENGRPVAAGIYYVRLTAGRSQRAYPIVLVR